MADTIDSISIELTASTQSAERSIQRVIDMLDMLNAMAIDTAESKISKSIRSIAKAAREIDSDAGQKLARLAGGLKALSKVGDLSNLADAGKNLSGVVRAVNSIGQSGGKGLSGLADGIKQTSDALGSINDADVSKLGAVRDALSGEMSGSLHTSARVNESTALGGMGTPEPSFGNMAAYGAMTVFKYTADSIRDATMAYREFGAALAGGGSTVDTRFTDSMMTVFKYTADSIRDATAAYREFRAALGSGVPPIFTNFADDAARAGGSVQMLTGNVGSNNEGPWVADEIRDAARAYDDVGNSASAAAQVIETEFVNPTGSAFSTLNNIIWGLGNSISHIGSGFSGIGSMLGIVGNAASTVGSGFMQFTGIAGFAKDILYGIGNDADTASKKMGGLAKMAQNVGGAFSRYGFAAIPQYFGGQLIGNIQKATKGLTGFFHSIVRIAKYRLIRTALKLITQGINEGIKNLYSWSQTADTTFYNSMNQIATATKYMGNSFAAMAAPLVNALAPAIDFIVDKFVDMFNTISQIIARLTGKSTYTVAKKVASTWGDAAKSASSGAKDAADEIKRTIMGFDEINKLSKESSGSGGGGGGGGSGGGASSMFEEMPIDSAVASFADSLKEAFLAGDWQELGTLLGNKVNELVDSIDWGAAGAIVGYYINGWFSTKYWTLDTINFTNIGSKIAEFLNNAIKEIHFDIIGASLVQKLTIIGDLIIGFFTDFDWGQAATSFSDFVKGIYNEISKWLDKYDWGDVGNTIYTKLEDALTNLDLSGIATSFVTALGKAIKAVVSAGAGFLAGFWADVTAYWDEHIKADDFTTTVHNILDAIGQGFSNLGEWVWNSIIKPFGAALTGNENWDTELLDVGKNIIEGIFKGITNVISDVGTWIKTNIFDPFLKWLKSVFGINSPATTMEEPGENIVLGIFQGIINALANVGQWVKDNIFDPIWNAIKEAGTTAIEIAVSLVQNVGEWATDIWNFLQNTGATIAKKIEAAFDVGKSFAGDVWDFVKTGAQTIVKTVNAIFTEVGTWAGNVWDAVKAGAETIVKEVKAIFTEVGKWAGNVWDAVKAGAETIVKEVKAIFTEVGEWAGNVWTAIKNGAETIVKEVKAVFTEVGTWAGSVWNAVKVGAETIVKTVNAIFSEVGKWAGNVWDTVKAGAETIVKEVKAIFTEVGTWAGNVWDTIKTGAETITKTVEAGMKKLGTWIDSVVDFILGPEASEKRTEISMALENTALGIINFLRDPVTAIKNVMLELGVKFAKGVEKFWNWITGQDGQSEVVVDAYGNFMIVPKAGEGLIDKGNGQFALTNDVAGTTVLTPEKSDNWQDEWDKLVGDEIDVKVKLNAVKGKVEAGVQTFMDNAGKTLTTTVSTILQKGSTWVNEAWTAITTKKNDVNVQTSLTKNGWTTISEFVGTAVTVLASLVKKDNNQTPGILFDVATALGFKGTLNKADENQTPGILFNVGTVLAFLGTLSRRNKDDDSPKSVFNSGTVLGFLGTLARRNNEEDSPKSVFNSETVLGFLGTLARRDKDSDSPKSVFNSDTVLGFLGTLSRRNKDDDSPKTVFNSGTVLQFLGSLARKNKDDDSPGKVFDVSTVLGFLGKLKKKDDKQKPSYVFKTGTILQFLGKLKAQNKTKDVFDTAITVTATLSTVIKGLGDFAKSVARKVNDELKKLTGNAEGGVIKNGKLSRFASGGIISNGVAQRLSSVPHYAGGTTDAHGTLFVAGEAGPEILGHIGGRTEILNQSQLAQTMFAAVRTAMQGVKIAATFYNGDASEGSEADYEMMYHAMYDAFTAAMAGSDAREQEKMALMRRIADKEFTAEVTASSVNRAQTRQNRRAGTTIISVGT